MITQEIRYTTTSDGVRIAWASSGKGPPLVKAANWLNHLEFDWESPVWRHIIRELVGEFRLIRYDQRGNGLSDWEVENLSFDAFVSDLEAVVDAAGLEKFSLFGISQGCAQSIAYAVRHPQRVDKLILHGGYARGYAHRSPEERERRRALNTLVLNGWGKNNPAFRQVFSAMFFPEGTADVHDAWNELQRITTSAENAVRIAEANAALDVRDLLPRVQAPALVLHCRNEEAVDFEFARELASGIPNARLVSIDSRNHLLLESEPGWQKWVREVRAFMGLPPEKPEDGAAVDAGVAARVPVADSLAAASPVGGAARAPGVDSSQALSAGEMLLHYRIEEHISSGGMGAVYRAHDTNLRRDVAVKMLPRDFVDDGERLARLQREARMLAALNHPNIAAIYGLESIGVGKFIVMELAAGGTLRDRLRAGPLSIEDALRVCRDVAAGLGAAHAKGIVHRDLKPSNVMLTAAGVKLLDFGIAKPVTTGELTMARDDDGASDDLTRSGVLLGTGPYMSPEQVRGQEIGKASDLWSFACLLYETLRGRSPFRRDTLADTLTAVLEHDADLGALPGNTPRGIVKLLERCLRKDARERLDDIEAARAVLDECIAGLGAGKSRGVFGWLKKGS
jgi:pimeloyl-ACP methyl ester carboxylesterase